METKPTRTAGETGINPPERPIPGIAPVESATRNGRRKLWEGITESEELIRRNPTQAALIGMGAGFLIAQLPLRYIAAAFIKLTLLVLRPAALVYAVSTILETSQRPLPEPTREPAR